MTFEYINKNLYNTWEMIRLSKLDCHRKPELYLAELERTGLRQAILSMLAYAATNSKYQHLTSVIIQYLGKVEGLDT